MRALFSPARPAGRVDWEERLAAHALRARFDEFSLLYHASVRPALPREYDVPGLVGLTFRYRRRPDGAHVYATVLDLPAVQRLGARLGLRFEEALAMVDSHERVHVWLQLAGVPEDVEEERMHVVDAVWQSLRDERLARHIRTGAWGVVTHVDAQWWEALIDTAQARAEREGAARPALEDAPP
jgi:hypothetical protein